MSSSNLSASQACPPHAARRAAFAALALLCLPCACARRPRPQNLLLIVVDTLRADHLSCYGYERETSPRLDELAADGLRFTHVQSPRAKTTPAIATLMSGLYPQQHGLRDLTMALDARVPTLAQELQRAGYRTAAIVGNFVLQKSLSALERGFQTWIEEFPETQGVPPDAVPQRTARSLTDGALELMGWGPAAPAAPAARAPAEPTQPFFLYLHYMDPHGLYDPPAEHRLFTHADARPIPPAESDARAGPETRIATYNVPPEAWLPDGRIDEAEVIDRYDGEIHFVDHEIGRLLDHMRRAGQLENTWVVVVADHGESLGEHRYWFEHGVYAYEASCRVPLIVSPPTSLAGRPAPGVRDSDLSLADLRPTLLAWLKLPAAPARASGPSGLSRAELLHAEASGRHPVFSEKVDRSERSRAVQTKAVRIGDDKLIRRYVPTGTPGEFHVVEQLFELRGDPAEEHDRLAQPGLDSSSTYAALASALEAFVRADEEFEELPRILQGEREALGRNDPETLRVLEALGY